MNSTLKKSYYQLATKENSIRHLFLLLIRLYWGGLLILVGLGKWLNIEATTTLFANVGIPFARASVYFVATLEILGGISLFLGYLTRLFCPLLTLLFLIAYATAHTEALTTLFQSPSLFTTQAPFLFLFTTLIVLCFGPGALSLDYWIEKRLYGKPL